MNRLKRFAILGATTGLLALALGVSSAPASASASPDRAPAAATAMDGDYTVQKWYEIYAYFTLEECQDAGQAFVDDPTTPYTDWYCNPEQIGGYWFYVLYLWRD